MKISYYVHWKYPEDEYEFKDTFDGYVECESYSKDLQDFAKKCADDYYSQHDGWEDVANGNDIIITIFDYLTEEELGTFEIKTEMEPIFYATRKN